MLEILRKAAKALPEEDEYTHSILDTIIKSSAHGDLITRSPGRHTSKNEERQDIKIRKWIVGQIESAAYAKAEINEISRKHLLDCLNKLRLKVMLEQCDPVECPI